jgi:cysteine desulfuration protein SufE
MTIQDKEREVVEEFSMFEDWMEKYEYIIELGKDLPIISEDRKVEDNLIKGCQSRVWVSSDFKEGKIHFTADSDAIITKGIIALLVRVMSDEKPEEIVKANLSFINEIGLQEHLSPTRANGLLGMVKRIKELALENC